MPSGEILVKAKGLNKLTREAMRLVVQRHGGYPFEIDKNFETAVDLVKSGELKFVEEKGEINLATPGRDQSLGSDTGTVRRDA